MGQIIKNHAVLICIVISVSLIGIAAALYPGGSLLDMDSEGFDWTKNFITNLFQDNALNGKENPGRIWAIIGIAFHALGYGIFFINMSNKISNNHGEKVLKIVGISNILFTFLIATPLHDMMVTISSTLAMLGIFYITVFTLKTKLHLIKIFCILSMLIFYFTLFLYGLGDWGLLAIMQKVAFTVSMLLVLVLEYFTKQTDYARISPGEQSLNATQR
ncbi:hypothetical protein L0U89_10945 [Mariniradius sp. RY-2]|uniref:DUF998 domain-containing protein n=2 Tax=Mariniradius sediminis TaxID=2909237 RepID=A0ABS9BU52_9BACT|nr:hypothetical protein [Mariniradius sediminis]